MFRQRRSRRLLRAVAPIAALTLGLFVVIPGSVAEAAKPATLAQVRKHVEALRNQAELATERYNAAVERRASLSIQMAAARAKLAQEQILLAAARRSLGKLAADTYKAGDLSTLALFLGDNADSELAADGLLMSLGDRRNNAVSTFLAQQKSLKAALADVTEQQKRLAATEQTLKTARVQVLQDLAAVTSQLARLSATQRVQFAQVSTMSEREAFRGLGLKVPASGRLTCDDVPHLAPSARAAQALGYACSKLGDSYVWAAAGPSTFDCSGLTMRAYEVAGVSLPHNAAMQAQYGRRVSAGNLQPGDLLFYDGYGHEGMYLGSGVMIHAPHSGDVVRISPVRYGSLVAATRP